MASIVVVRHGVDLCLKNNEYDINDRHEMKYNLIMCTVGRMRFAERDLYFSL